MNADERRLIMTLHPAALDDAGVMDRHANSSKSRSMSKSRIRNDGSDFAPTHTLASTHRSYRSICVHLRLSAALFILVAATARAANPPEVSMDVDIGFNSAYRMGAWTPLYVTIASRTPRAVRIEVNFPHDQTAAMKIVQQVSATPTPATYMLLAPATFYDVSLLSVSVIDSRNSRRLANFEPQNAPSTRAPPRAVSGGELFVVYAGEAPVPRVDLGELATGALQVGSVEANRLPAAPIGYESLDVLMLGALDFARLDGAVQQAIADYVFAGGTLVCWPSDGPLPPDSPLTKLLPANAGPADTVQFSESQLTDIGLGSRFSKIGWRVLTPHSDATVFYAAADAIPCYSAPRGHGKVVLLPLRANQLQFTSETANQKFWRDIFTAATSNDRIQLHNKGQNRNYNNYQQDAAVVASADFVMNLLGDVPGIDQFGFGYVAWIMVGLMVIVGPVDWFLLKWTRRQPWTIATTTGWIALITLAAIYIGHLVRSGDLHFRTLRLVDQIDNRVVSSTHVAALYSPNTNRYELETPADSWWQPLSAQMYYYGSGGMKADFAFHQNQSRNEPLPLRIPIWNIRFLRGDDYTAAAPMLAADLRIPNDETHRIRGTITNLCDHPLQDIWVSHRQGTTKVVDAPLAPGERRAIDEILTNWPPNNVEQQQQYNSYYGYGQSWTEEAMKLPVNQYRHCFGLLRVRDREIPPPALNPDIITIFAAADVDPPSLKLLDAKPLQRHRTLIRAIVPVQKETPSTQPQ